MKIDARDITGAKFAVNLSELPARVFQHEFDHLQASPLIFIMLIIDACYGICYLPHLGWYGKCLGLLKTSSRLVDSKKQI